MEIQQSPWVPNRGYTVHDESDRTQVDQSLAVSSLPCAQARCPGGKVHFLGFVTTLVAFYGSPG